MLQRHKGFMKVITERSQVLREVQQDVRRKGLKPRESVEITLQSIIFSERMSL